MAAIEDYRWLIGPDAAKWLDRLSAMATTGASTLQLVERLRTDLTSARAHLLVEQLELRNCAAAKFSAADAMFFTRQALEQATDEWIAAYKAGRFPMDQLVADLCCGIGGDLICLASRGEVLGIDRDPVMALLAHGNLRVLRTRAGECRAKVVTSDVGSFDLARVAAWHIDPDRRPSGRRTTRVELHEPGPEQIRQMLDACPHGAIKLAPAATFEEPWWHEAELEWISRGRQCRQLVAWFGRLAQHSGKRRATVVCAADPNAGATSQFGVVATFIGEPNVECPIASRVGRFVFEPDAAVLAAKLEGALAASENLAALAGGIAYFTADELSNHGALACFEVLEVMPYQIKRLRAWLAARGIGRLEIKKRGVPLEPEQVRRELQTGGDGESTIMLARIAGRITAVVARRV